MPRLSYRICEPYFGGYRCWYIYDSYYQMLIHQCSPGYRTKFEAEQECRKRNQEYKALKIQKGDTYKTKSLDLSGESIK